MFVGYWQAETGEFILSLTRVTCVVWMDKSKWRSRGGDLDPSGGEDGAPKKPVSTVAADH